MPAGYTEDGSIGAIGNANVGYPKEVVCFNTTPYGEAGLGNRLRDVGTPRNTSTHTQFRSPTVGPAPSTFQSSRFGTENSTGETVFAALQKARRAADNACLQISELVSRAPSRPSDSGDQFVHRMREVVTVFDAEFRSLSDGRGSFGNTIAAGNLDNFDSRGMVQAQSRSFGVLRQSVEDAERRCSDLNSGMLRQAEANEEMMQTLSTVKDSNKRLLDKIQAQADEIARLTEQRVTDEERIDSLIWSHRLEEDAWSTDVRQRVAAVSEATTERIAALERKTAEQLHTIGARLKPLREEFATLQRRFSAVEARGQVDGFRGHLKAMEDRLVSQVVSHSDRFMRQRNAFESSSAELLTIFEEEAESRFHDLAARAQRQAALGAGSDDCRERSARQLEQLSSQCQALSRAVRVEREAAVEEKTFGEQQLSRSAAEREELEAALTDMEHEIVRLESVRFTLANEARTKEQSIADLRQQNRESDDALAAAVSGNEHLRKQLDEHKDRSREVGEAEMMSVRSKQENKMARAKDTQEVEIEAASEEIRSIESTMQMQASEAAKLETQAGTLSSEVEAMRSDLATWKARYEAASRARQGLEAELADARKDFARDRLRLQSAIDQMNPQNSAAEEELRTVTEQFKDAKRVLMLEETELKSRVGAIEDLVRDTQLALAEVNHRLAETVGVVDRTTAEAHESQRRAAVLQQHLENDIEQKSREFAEERRRLEEQLASERDGAVKSREQSDQHREAHSLSFRRLQDECDSKVEMLERERLRAEEQHRVGRLQNRTLLAQQETRVEQLERDLNRVRLLLSESRSNLEWVRQERDRELREAGVVREHLHDELKNTSGALSALVHDESSAKAQLDAAMTHQKDQNKQLSSAIDKAKQKCAAQHARHSEQLRQMMHEFDARARTSEVKNRDSILSGRMRLQALTRENDQLKRFLGEQQHAPRLRTEAAPEIAAGTAARSSSNHSSQLESHIQRLQKHTEELRSDLQRSGRGQNASLPGISIPVHKPA
eukprot:TRINITY_DN4928_c0_g1_i1.p1 TRINITY_DN4928_c0_g1~~TRINITY_DN4928_c0_g1_i1.p1  ORF type:complete len:1023 (-),score=183.85 TRINITY_DN4928_c0_g1_i1:168-3200(-)